MKALVILACSFIITSLTMTCKQESIDTCTAPQMISVDQNCYTGKGLTLTASDYGKDLNNFKWEIYAVKDTTKAISFMPKDLQFQVDATNQLMVPDSIVSRNQKIVAVISSYCQKTNRLTTYFTFVKSSSSAGNCTRWVSRSY